MEVLCCLFAGLLVFWVLSKMFSSSPPPQDASHHVTVTVVPPPAPVAPEPLARLHVEPPVPEPARPTKCSSCGANLGRKGACEYCGDGQ